MKKITLKRIELTNFKGIAHRVEEFKDGENWIIGKNGSGKTTIFDAFIWTLFGVDSKGQSDKKAQIKMMDQDGNPVMHVDNSVEMTLIVDGEELVLKRVFKEHWSKPFGSPEPLYKGQTTKFSWNGNEKINETEYKKRVNDLIDGSLFKLVTDPMYFASLDTSERRKIVLGMAGDVSDDTIRAHNQELNGFDPSKNVDEKRKVALSSKNALTKDRDNYPARIDELMQGITRKEQELKELALPDKQGLLAKKEEMKLLIKLVEEKQSHVANIVADVIAKNTSRMEMMTEVESYARRKQLESNSKIDKINDGIREAKRNVNALKNQIGGLDMQIKNAESVINDERDELNHIKNQIEKIREEKEPDYDVTEICPLCGKPYEPEELEEKQNELRNKWKAEQKKQIEELKDRGNKLFENASEYKKKLKSLLEQKEETQKQLDENLAKVKDEDEIPYEKLDLSEDTVYQEMVAKIPEEQSVNESVTLHRNELIAKKNEYQNIIEMIDQELQSFTKHDILTKDIELAKERIEVLKQEQLKVNQGIADAEKTIYLCDLWVKTRIELLNQVVSSKFELVKFKMFEYNKDGNARPTCEITVDGVDYTALNTASKINAGLDIINALINYYNVKAPIFIDNRESVTNIIAPDTQIINLAVDSNLGGEN